MSKILELNPPCIRLEIIINFIVHFLRNNPLPFMLPTSPPQRLPYRIWKGGSKETLLTHSNDGVPLSFSLAADAFADGCVGGARGRLHVCSQHERCKNDKSKFIQNTILNLQKIRTPPGKLSGGRRVQSERKCQVTTPRGGEVVQFNYIPT